MKRSCSLLAQSFATGFSDVNFDSGSYKIRDNTGAESNIASVDLATHLVSFQRPTVTTLEGRGPAVLTVSLNTPATAPVSVDYVVGAQSARGRGEDFSLAGGTINFAVGEKTKTIMVPLVNDLLDEDNETLQVWLTSTTGPAAVGKNRSTTLTIQDDDATPKVSFRTKASVWVENQSASIEVFLSAVSGRTVTVKYLLAGNTAKSPDDYSVTPTNLTFAPGDTSKFLDIAVVDDALDEADETVKLRLTQPKNALIGLVNTHTYTIRSDDPLRTVAFDVADVTAGEAAGTVQLTVRLSAPSLFPMKVAYAVEGATATLGKDYVLTKGTLTFKAGETEKKILVRVLNDVTDEPAETIAIRVSNPTNVALGLIDLLTLTIDDDDPD